MITNIIIILMTILTLSVVVFIVDALRPRYCKKCGTKMDRFYDVEEDAEVLQCPNCGRSYLIK